MSPRRNSRPWGRVEIEPPRVEFGRRALQDDVQAQVGFQGFWIPTGIFCQHKYATGRANGEAVLKSG